MILSHNGVIFIHAFNHKLDSIGEICGNSEAEKIFAPFPTVMDGVANRDHCIATGSMISLARLNHRRDGRSDVAGTIKSDSISAFVC
jgi:hypothetical protein